MQASGGEFDDVEAYAELLRHASATIAQAVAVAAGEAAYMESADGEVDRLETVRNFNIGQIYTERLLASEETCQAVLRLHRSTFYALLDQLSSEDNEFAVIDGQGISKEQKLAILLQIIGQGDFYRACALTYGHSISTISRVFHEVLNSVLHLYEKHIFMPQAENLPLDLRQSGKFHLFNKALGAIDGTHIHAYVPLGCERRSEGATAKPWINRKGWISQNVLACCDWEMNFTYVYAGWEGSAHDKRVLNAARMLEEGAFKIPRGFYLLADAGYFGRSADLLSNYKGTRYHLSEFASRGSDRPKLRRELFNLRHAQMRNVIERTFGAFKRRWRFFDTGREFDIEVQVKVVYAACVLHNFANRRGDHIDPGEAAEAEESTKDEAAGSFAPRDQESLADEGDSPMEQLWLHLADQMWNEYQAELVRRQGTVDNERVC